jgi:hypothetical protein
MPRPPGQSDFVFRAPVEELAMIELPASADPVELPRAVLRSHEASARATRVVLTATWIMLGILLLLCMIGPHIPSGE